jgi:release factor glutamine methyltransferase
MTVQGTTWRDLYELAATALGSRQQAGWVIEEVGEKDWPLRGFEPAPPAAWGMVDRLLARSSDGEPLQYIFGHWSFRRLELLVDSRVLIPRPETEVLVDEALRELDGHGRNCVVVDLGTGSGAIALSIAIERPGVEVWATDVSAPALQVASANLARLDARTVAKVRLAHGDWWSALPHDLRGQVDLVVSNPPYISSAEMDGLDPAVLAWEPREALESGPTGLEAIEAILLGAQEWLRPDGAAVIELAPHQAPSAAELARRAGFANAEVRKDLAGRDRVLVAGLQGVGIP